MARLFYGHSGADVSVAPQAVELDLQLATSKVFWAYTARIAGTRHTDLLSRTGSAITEVTPDSDGRLIWQGLDAYTGGYWLEDQDDTSKPRWHVQPTDLAERTGGGATVHGSLSGLTTGDDHTQYQKEADKGAASGYASLDGTTKVPIAQLPTGTTSSTTSLGNHTHAGGGGVSDHGGLTGLTDDDHTQYTLRTGSARQFADVDDTAPFDGSVCVWESDTNLYVPTDLSNRFAAVDTDGRIAPATYPQWYTPLLVINEGDPVPTNFPPGGVVLSRPSAGSLVPVGAGNNFSLASGTCAVTTTQAFAVGDYIGFGIGASGEITLPTTYTVTYATGAGAKSAAGTAFQTGSIQADLHYARVTTAIPLGTVVTLTANQNRTHFMVSLVKMVSLAATAALDQTATAQGAASSPLTLTVGPSGTTTQAQEWGLAVFGSNPGVSTQVRTLSGSGGWQAVGPTVEAENVTPAARSVSVFFRQLTTTGAVTATAQVTTSDGTNAAWAGVLGTFKAA